MELVHIGLVSSTAERAERFFGELLGLPKTRTTELPRETSRALFGVDQAIGIAYYGGDGMLFEVFLTGWDESFDRRISHTCIQVADRAAFLARCREMDYVLREVRKGEKTIVFLEDGDGNLFEVSERRLPS